MKLHQLDQAGRVVNLLFSGQAKSTTAVPGGWQFVQESDAIAKMKVGDKAPFGSGFIQRVPDSHIAHHPYVAPKAAVVKVAPKLVAASK